MATVKFNVATTAWKGAKREPVEVEMEFPSTTKALMERFGLTDAKVVDYARRSLVIDLQTALRKGLTLTKSNDVLAKEFTAYTKDWKPGADSMEARPEADAVQKMAKESGAGFTAEQIKLLKSLGLVK